MEYKKNEMVTVKITDIGSEGEGIGKLDGFTLFVKDAVIGDEVKVSIMKAKKNYAYARLEKVITPSPFRVEPKCRFYRQCGGCQLQSMAYEKQLAFKQNKVKNSLIRLGGFPEDLIERVMEEPVGMEVPYYYRNKAQFPFGYDRDGNVITGFYAGRTHNIIANTDCALGAAENRDILEVVLRFMKENNISAYNEQAQQGLLRHILIRKGFATGQLMVCPVINGNHLPQSGKLVEMLKEIPGMTSISLNTNREHTNVIMGRDCKLLWGSPTIEDRIGGITFRISPLSFYQVNPVQTERIYGQALAYAGLTGKETVWDLYCGIGTISLFLAQKARKVYGVEIVPEAIENARENTVLNGITNTEFFIGRAEEVLPREYEGNGIRADVIVVDPPRKGCDPVCLETMLKMRPERIVYVSCDPATLARDLKELCEGGYEMVKGRVFDNFPNGVHVESVCLLSKLHSDQHIEVELNELDLTAAEVKATYHEIKAYILGKYGVKVSSLYIAQVKEKHGIIERENYNKAKSEKSRQPKCPAEKEVLIEEVLKQFKMI